MFTRRNLVYEVVATLVVLAMLAGCAPAAPQARATSPATQAPVVPPRRNPAGRPTRPLQPGQNSGTGTRGGQTANCSNTSIGLTPLTDLGTGQYQGFEGGLYPNGSNQPPADYEQQGLAHAQKIQPLNADGQPDPNGKIVLLSIGMSNTDFEYAEFMREERGDAQRNPQVQPVNGAIPTRAANDIKNPADEYWSGIQQRLSQAHVTSNQVQAIWLLEAISYNDEPLTPFPQDAQELQADLGAIIKILEQTFPNLQIVYVSSRNYAGYASIQLSPEPQAYDSGFAVQWVVEDRINGKTSGSSWVAWGPYLWADGTHPRSDGLVWNCGDFGPDGTHPVQSGTQKVAAMLSSFLKSDPTASPWFVKR